MNETNTTIIIALIMLVGCSAFFSATETAFSSVNKIRLKNMANDGDKKAKKALDLAENYDKLLTTILVGNNLVNIMATALATVNLATAADRHIICTGLQPTDQLPVFGLGHIDDAHINLPTDDILPESQVEELEIVAGIGQIFFAIVQDEYGDGRSDGCIFCCGKLCSIDRLFFLKLTIQYKADTEQYQQHQSLLQYAGKRRQPACFTLCIFFFSLHWLLFIFFH